MNRYARRLALAAGIVAIGVLGACGGDDDSEPTETSSETSSEATDDTTETTEDDTTTTAEAAPLDCGPLSSKQMLDIAEFETVLEEPDASDGFGGAVSAEYSFFECTYQVGDEFAQPEECPEFRIRWMTAATVDGEEIEPIDMMGPARESFDLADTGPSGDEITLTELPEVGADAFVSTDNSLLYPNHTAWASGQDTAVAILAVDRCSETEPDVTIVEELLALATTVSP